MKIKNNTGIPSDLKTQIESLSGLNMDDVRVHYNSAKPSHLQAHAHGYTQGTVIYLAPGQEKLLAHELTHVVQQKQGRVNPINPYKSDCNPEEVIQISHDGTQEGQIYRRAPNQNLIIVNDSQLEKEAITKSKLLSK